MVMFAGLLAMFVAASERTLQWLGSPAALWVATNACHGVCCCRC